MSDRPGSVSSLAVNVLRPEKARSEMGDDDDAAGSSAHGSRSLLSRIRSRHDKDGGASSVAGSAQDTTHTPQLSMVAPAPPRDAGQSIQQSVKMFRTIEIIRTGDTEAITKAVTDDIRGQGPDGTSTLHLAVQVAEPTTAERILTVGAQHNLNINEQDKDGNTPLHLAAMLGRSSLVRLLLAQKDVDSSVSNYQGRSPLELAKTSEVFQQLQLDRAMFTETQVKAVKTCVVKRDYAGLEKLLDEPKVTSVIDLDSPELASEQLTVESAGSLLHEAARNRDLKMIQLLLLHGADPFRRDKRGKLPQDVTKDEKTRAILKKSPAATSAQRGVQEKAILGKQGTGEGSIAAKESREMKGYLKKWTNYTSGYKLRWFVLEDGVLSYYKNQDDAGSACRGAMNMRIAKLSMDAEDKSKIGIEGKSSVKYFLKANHNVEAKRWFWSLNNAIQWAKDEAREEQKREAQQTQATRQAISEHKADLAASSNRLAPTTAVDQMSESFVSLRMPPGSVTATSIADDASASGSVDFNARQPGRSRGPTAIAGDLDEEDDFGDDASDHEVQPVPRDAFDITAHSAGLQLKLLSQVSGALQAQSTSNPHLPISDPSIKTAVSTYDSAVKTLQGMVLDLLRISKDRETYWQYKLDRETDMRRLWEESMAKLAYEQEELEGRIGESEEKRKATKKALREVLEESTIVESATKRENLNSHDSTEEDFSRAGISRRKTVTTLHDLSDLESDDDEEFFDAVGAGEVPIEPMPKSPPPSTPVAEAPTDVLADASRSQANDDIVSSFRGYEDPLRTRLALDADNRPQISLWGILKSMIGKDMTKMTLPVSFNEPTSLLQRMAEDMEYTDLLDTAAEHSDSSERLLYVAAFAASEYASTIGRVAKPFNPLLGETYEYARPDKGYRFMVEQVSHHPPIGAAWGESAKWTYYGESAVKSKFYGKSFDINPLGTWFLKLRPTNGHEELFTWKKVTTSVVGIITGSPTVDNYGPMEIKNWTTGETCLLDFKPRGWKASSAYQVAGKVASADGTTRWSLGGRWNDKIFARLTPGYEANLEGLVGSRTKKDETSAFLIWQANPRPTGIPFNLTPFGLTLNALPQKLKSVLPPTDARLRPDQRAMEDGAYDLAATEKNRVEEKQRAKRRIREANGEEFVSRWFKKSKCEISGEEYWSTNGEYWPMRAGVAKGGKWVGCEDIF